MSKLPEDISTYLIAPSDTLIVDHEDLSDEFIDVTKIDQNTSLTTTTNENATECDKQSIYDVTSEESVMSFQDGQEVQLDDGTIAFIFHNNIKGNYPDDSVQSIQLENGNTAYLYHPKSLNNINLVWPDTTNANKSQTSMNFAQSSSNDAGTSTTIDFNIANGYDKKVKTNIKHDFYKVYKCEHENCNKAYSSAHHLKIHIRSHTGEKPYLCEWKDCKKDFSTSYALKSHHRVHTGEKPYTCPEGNCNKAFKTSGDLRKHVRTHTGEKPFHCPFEGCGKAFTTSNICKVHIRTHTGEKPHKCPYENCNKSFSNITNYKNHIRIHTGEKPYVCSLPNCRKQFTEYSSLYKHQSVHAIVKPFQCSYCGKHYRKAKGMIEHKKKVHNDLNGLNKKDCIKLPKFVTDSSYTDTSTSETQNSFTFKKSPVLNNNKSLTPSVVVVSNNQGVRNMVDSKKQVCVAVNKKKKITPSSDAVVITSIVDPLICDRKRIKTLPNISISSIPSSLKYGDLYINEEMDQTCSVPNTSPTTESSRVVSDISNQSESGIWLDCEENIKDVTPTKDEEIPYVTIDIDGQKYLVQIVQESSIPSDSASVQNINKDIEKKEEEKIVSTFDYIVPGSLSKIRLISSPKSSTSGLSVLPESIISTSMAKDLTNETTS